MTGRRGFTLIEVLVGLTIAGAALLIARGLFREAADRGKAVLAVTNARGERARALQGFCEPTKMLIESLIPDFRRKTGAAKAHDHRSVGGDSFCR